MAVKLDPEKVALWHKWGLWSAEMVDEAVSNGVLTKTQANKIKKEAVK